MQLLESSHLDLPQARRPPGRRFPLPAADKSAWSVCTALALLAGGRPQEIQDELATQSATSTPWWWGLKTMVKYRAPRNYRDEEWIGSRVGDKVIMSLLMWTMYFGVGNSYSTTNLINVPNLLFMWCILPAYGAAGYLPSLVMERALYVRERSDGLYLAVTYLLAKMVEEVTITLVTSIWVAAVAFYAVNLQGSFAVFWLVYLLDLLFGMVRCARRPPRYCSPPRPNTRFVLPTRCSPTSSPPSRRRWTWQTRC